MGLIWGRVEGVVGLGCVHLGAADEKGLERG